MEYTFHNIFFSRSKFVQNPIFFFFSPFSIFHHTKAYDIITGIHWHMFNTTEIYLGHIELSCSFVVGIYPHITVM